MDYWRAICLWNVVGGGPIRVDRHQLSFITVHTSWIGGIAVFEWLGIRPACVSPCYIDRGRVALAKVSCSGDHIIIQLGSDRVVGLSLTEDWRRFHAGARRRRDARHPVTVPRASITHAADDLKSERCASTRLPGS